jgi:hypothetical protein
LSNRVTQDDTDTVLNRLMIFLCSNHRINARNGLSTVFEIEQIRTDGFTAFDSNYFKDILMAISNQTNEIHVNGERVQLTNRGIDNCRDYVENLEYDF